MAFDPARHGAAPGALPAIEVIYPKVKRLETADMVGAGGIAARALAAVGAMPAQQQQRAAGSVASVDPLPPQIVARHGLMGWLEALRALHAPTTAEEHRRARTRLAFQEMFLGQLAAMLERRRLTSSPDVLTRPWGQQQQQQPPEQGPTDGAAEAGADTHAGSGRPRGRWPISVTRLEAMAAARRALPYKLTAAQERALADILSDLVGPAVMMRLLQGDVGCGKTVVALMAMMAAAGSGRLASRKEVASCVCEEDGFL